MALIPTLTAEAWGELDALFQAEYDEQDDGSYLLSVTPTGGLALENVAGLKATISSLRGENAKATKTLKAFGDIDPETAKDAVEKAAELAGMDLDAKVEEAVKSREQQLIKKHSTDLDTAHAERDAMRGTLEGVMIQDAATSALASNKGNVDLLLPHVVKQAKLRQVDGDKFTVEIVDVDGNVLISPATGSTAPMTINELVVSMRADKRYQAAFEGDGTTGSGGANDNSSPGKPAKGASKSVDAADGAAMSDSLEGIATGDVKVTGLE